MGHQGREGNTLPSPFCQTALKLLQGAGDLVACRHEWLLELSLF